MMIMRILTTIYLDSIITSLILYVLYCMRLDKKLAEKGYRLEFNRYMVIYIVKSLICCFTPIYNIYFIWVAYKYAVVVSDEEFEAFINEKMNK